MVGMRPVGPTAGITATTRLGRDSFVRIADNDYSVDSGGLSGFVPTTVGVTCAGTLVAAH